ncbi:hypothetical protein SRIMM317S_04524 [Streptomyces rimosus subsp. rimosus]
MEAPDPLPRGARNITTALRDRLGDMEDQLAQLDRQLDRRSVELAERFNPRRGLLSLLKKHDPFRLERVFTGNPGDRDRVAQPGFSGMLDNRRNRPQRPEGVDTSPPQVPRSAAGWPVWCPRAGATPRWTPPSRSRTPGTAGGWPGLAYPVEGAGAPAGARSPTGP